MLENFEKEPLKIKRRGEDGYKMISVRIREDILVELDRIAARPPGRSVRADKPLPQ